ncbi:hypothetical protein F4780DRAFT_632350 [Xylariomycetidae sp. FL0641]|nr:hypothetical protein F4780DRAFT_632350 [Xylariomycetidae sp. FL0641]
MHQVGMEAQEELTALAAAAYHASQDAVHISPPTSFHLFPRLPGELRAAIAGHAARIPEFVHLQYEVLPASGPGRLQRPWITCANLGRFAGLLRASHELRYYALRAANVAPPHATYDWSCWAARFLSAPLVRQNSLVASDGTTSSKGVNAEVELFARILRRILHASNSLQPFIVQLNGGASGPTVLRPRPLLDVFFLEDYLTTAAETARTSMMPLSHSLTTVRNVLLRLEDIHTALDKNPYAPHELPPGGTDLVWERDENGEGLRKRYKRRRSQHAPQRPRGEAFVSSMTKLLGPLVAAGAQLQHLQILVGPWPEGKLPGDLRVVATSVGDVAPRLSTLRRNTRPTGGGGSDTLGLGGGTATVEAQWQMAAFVDEELTVFAQDATLAKPLWRTSFEGLEWRRGAPGVYPPHWIDVRPPPRWSFVMFG